MSKESLVRSELNKKSNVPKQFHHLIETIPFPLEEIYVCPNKKNHLIHYSLHNWPPRPRPHPSAFPSTNPYVSPTLCIHGLNGSRLVFSEFISVISAYYPSTPLIAIDLFGHGLSSCPSVKYNVDLFVFQIESLLAHLQISKINIIGFSLGGAVTVGFAARFPQRIDKLVLISPAGFVPIASGKKETKKRPQPVMTDSISLSSEQGENEFQGISSHVKLIKYVPSCILNPVAKMLFKSAFSKPQPPLPPSIPEEVALEHKMQMDRLMWQSFVKKGTIEATMSIVKNFPLFNMEKDYVKVAQSVVGKDRPVLLIWGEQDQVNPLKKTAKKIQSYFQNSILVTVPDSGHVVLNEQPTVVISSIISFLQAAEGFRFDKN